jgi:hypothetical protein
VGVEFAMDQFFDVSTVLVVVVALVQVDIVDVALVAADVVGDAWSEWVAVDDGDSSEVVDQTAEGAEEMEVQ